MKAKGKAAGLLCMILTVAYAVYIIPHLLNAGSFSLEREAAAFLAAPHLVCAAAAAVFTIIGFFGKAKWAFLTAGILLIFAAFTFMYYAIPVIVLSVLAFIAYAGTGVKA